MKKLALSLGVIFAFGIYSLTQQKAQTEIVALPGPTPAISTGVVGKKYKDGEYLGKVADAYYGNIQVKAIIRNGNLTDVQFLQFPKDHRHSIAINRVAMPILKSEAISVQDENVDIVSGATDSSLAFVESLRFALGNATI